MASSKSSILGALHTMWTDMANAFVGTLSDMYPNDGNDGYETSGSPSLIAAVSKNQRYMQLALIFLAFLLVTQMLEHV